MKSDILWLDYETRSKCDLIAHGAYNYAQDPSTQPLCLGYAFNDEAPTLWWPSEPFPERIKQHFTDGGQCRAHNAGFDRLITEFIVCPDYGIPAPPLSAWYCTATQARANCAPGKLEDVGRFAGTAARKNSRGSFLIRALSLPRADGAFNDDPELMHEMGRYCLDDIIVMREFSNAMRQLSDEELHDYHINEKINDRGVRIDRRLAQAAQRYSTIELDEVQAQVKAITKGLVPTVRSSKMKEWVLERIGDDAKKLMEVWAEGDMRYSLDKSIRANLLLMDDSEQLPPDVLEVIQCADDIWSSSVAKYKRLDELADTEDNRVRGAFVFAGGVATGRASSYGAQVHNFTRKVAKNAQDIADAMIANKPIVPKFGARCTDVLKSMLRPTLIPAKGMLFVVSDWSAIEARVAPWLTNDPLANDLLDTFRAKKDVYTREAKNIYRVLEEEIIAGIEAEDAKYTAMRQVGKVATLALGYQGGVNAFAEMGKGYGISMPESDVRAIVRTWRAANPWAVQFWAALENAYKSAIRHPDTPFSAGRITYLYDTQHLWYALPSGRVLCYPYAKFEGDGVTYAKAAWRPKADATEWPRANLYGGLAFENCTQATSNCLLRHALRICDDEDLPVVLHCHDEIVVEVNSNIAADEKQLLDEIMVELPIWAKGLPLAAESKIMARYGK